MRCSSKTEDLNEALRLLQLIGLMYNVNRKGNYYQNNHMIILSLYPVEHVISALGSGQQNQQKKKSFSTNIKSKKILLQFNTRWQQGATYRFSNNSSGDTWQRDGLTCQNYLHNTSVNVFVIFKKRINCAFQSHKQCKYKPGKYKQTQINLNAKYPLPLSRATKIA